MWSDAYDRYKTPVTKVFSVQNKISLQLKVEACLAEVLSEFQIIDQDDAISIQNAVPKVTVERVREIDQVIHHDLMAMVRALAEQAGSAGEKVHLGATSSDILDTVMAIQIQQSKELLQTKFRQLLSELAELAETNKSVKCLGRTHGQAAVPTTIGFKLVNFMYELSLAIKAMEEVPTNLSKFSGSVGTYASIITPEIEEKVLAKLDLEPADVSTQVLSRVIHAQFLSSLALIAGVIERLSKEIRNLQRTEISEWFEPFTTTQVGSSAMPHKRNPHKSERISGLSRIIRANVISAFENIALEHERDISHSSVERIIIPESINLLYYITDQMINIISNLEINFVNVEHNLLSNQYIYSEQLLKYLINKVGRQTGHELLRKHLHKKEFLEAIKSDPEILKHISHQKINEITGKIETGYAEFKVEQYLIKYNHSTLQS